MGETLNPDDIKEGDDVYFECIVRANPKVYKLAWFKDVSVANTRVSITISARKHFMVYLRFVVHPRTVLSLYANVIRSPLDNLRVYCFTRSLLQYNFHLLVCKYSNYIIIVIKEHELLLNSNSITTAICTCGFRAKN